MLVFVVKSSQEPNQVCSSRKYDKHVEYLMRAAQDVESSRVPPLRNSGLRHCQWLQHRSNVTKSLTYRIDRSSNHVQRALTYEPGETDLFL